MKVYLAGDFSEKLDEGYKNIAFHTAEELSPNYEIIKINIKKIFSLNFWNTIKKSDPPQIIHYLTAPSLASFILLKILVFYWDNKPKTIISALFPKLSYFSKRFIPLFKPDLILIQSNESEKTFNHLGCRTKYLPNGVDTNRFAPTNRKIKEKLREKYRIDKEKFVVLHVGHLMRNRNLQIFEKIQGKDVQVIIIGSEYIKVNQKIYQRLKKIGCIIHLGYVKNIEEMYALSDCYIFPVIKGCSILMPLSVMEAMSCNLPVITSNFDGLIKFFSQGDGLIYAKKEVDFTRAVDRIKDGIEIKTREKILPYSWKNISIKLEEIYNYVL